MLGAFVKKLFEIFVCGGDVTATPKGIFANVSLVRLQTTAKLYISAVFACILFALSNDARAAAFIKYVETAGTTTVTFSGSLVVPEVASTLRQDLVSSLVNSTTTSFVSGLMGTSPSMNNNVTATCTSATLGGTTSPSYPSASATSGALSLAVRNSQIAFPLSYYSSYSVNGTAYPGAGTIPTTSSFNLTGYSQTFSGKSFATLGITSGTTITCTYNTTQAGGTTDTVTIQAYTSGSPVIESISPATGTTSGGTSITITGANFSGATSVTIGGVAATGVTLVSSTSITATTPASASTGAKDIVVTTAGTTATYGGGFTYSAAPVASAVSATVAYNSSSNSITLSATNSPTSVAVSTAASHGTATASGTSITYTPTTGYYGTDTFQYTATNATGTSSPATATITISAPTLVASPAAGALTAGTVGTAYSQTLSTSGGASPYTYAVTTGSLPAGLSLDSSTGVISGTPTAAGTSNFTITATDSSTTTHATKATSYSLVVSLATQATLTAVPAATTINTNGTTSLSSSGGSGTGAVTYAVASGSCTISSTTLTAPATAGTCTVTATKAADSTYASATSAAVTITVNTTPTPTLTFATIGSASVMLTGSLTNAATSSIPSGGAISYSSASTAVATVNSSGVITPVSAGTSIITATQAASTGVNASATQTYTLTVNALLTPTLTFTTPTAASVALAGALTNAATSNYSGGSYGAISYSSSNTGVATVDSSGVITTVAAGTAVITATQAAVAGVNAQATQTYTLTVLSTNAALSNLAMSGVTLSPTFSATTYTYTSSVASSVTSLTVTPTVAQANATVTVNGTLVTSGSASSSISLAVGTNTITVVVTAQDGVTTKTYTTTVTRVASSDATLSAMTISSGTLSPTFASGTTSYTASVTNSVSSITLTPTRNQANATITVNGTAVTSGSASGSISLSVGSNTITTIVTAQDASTLTYTTTVTRAALLTQATFTVSASPTTLNVTTTTSTISSSGGSGTGAVSYAMTTGTCTLSGTTVTAGSASETCTVTATKASDGTYSAATATVSITVAKRATIAAAAADSSVTTLHAAQVMQAQKFAVTQVQNVTAHLDSLRHNFMLQPSNLGIGLNIPSFSGPMSQVFYKIKDELTYQAPDKQTAQRSNLSSPASSSSSYSSSPFLKTAYVDEGAPKPFNDYLNDPSTKKLDDTQEQTQDQTHSDEPPQGYYQRENLTYSFWSAGTIDVGTFMTGQKDALNKLRASGLTFGLDYKLDDAAIVGGAIGVGKGWINDNSSSSNIQSNQLTFTGYGMVALDGTWIVDGLAGYGRMDISGIRTTSDGSAVLGMSRRGDTFFSSVSVSKLYWIGGLKISPFIREDWIKINLGSYSETGAADYALGYDGTNIINTKSSAGLFIVHDEYLERGKLTTSAKFAMNVAKTGDIQQNIYYVDTGSSGGTATLSQLSTNQVSQSVTLGMLYTQKSGDSFDIGFTQAVGANQYKQSSYRFTLRFAM